MVTQHANTLRLFQTNSLHRLRLRAQHSRAVQSILAYACEYAYVCDYDYAYACDYDHACDYEIFPSETV